MGSVTHGCCLRCVQWHGWCVMGMMGHEPRSCIRCMAVCCGDPAGACASGVPPVPASLQLTRLQIPKLWLPRYIRRSHIHHPWRPLSLQFNGKLRLKGLKSGIKAAVARLLAAGDAHRRIRGAGAGAMAPSPAALPGLCQE